jgi:hypothetical protein
MDDNTRLAQMIHSHWLKHQPQMVEELEHKNMLSQALHQAQERTADILYELVSVKKMDYQAAWELATEGWALPETEALLKEPSSVNPNPSPPSSPRATSE